MQNGKIRLVTSQVASREAWLELKRLKNRERIKRQMVIAHEVPKKFWKFVDKQAVQGRLLHSSSRRVFCCCKQFDFCYETVAALLLRYVVGTC
jgi:hypothetical protein